METNPLTSFFYADPSLLEGIARTIDLGATLEEYNSSPSEKMADYYALLADWLVTHSDATKSFQDTLRSLHERMESSQFA